MAVTYSDHVDRALRAAAIVLTLPAPSGKELDAVRRLHDDVSTTLAETARLVWTSALGEPSSERDRAGVTTARTMLSALESYPRLGIRTGAPDSPTQRWSGRPSDLATELSALDAWKVLAAETFLARSCLDQLGPRITTPIRASVLSNAALTAEALATTTADLARAGSVPATDHVLGHARDLASAAAQVQRAIASTPEGRGAVAMPAVPAARNRREVQLIRQHSDVAPALGNLARLTATGNPRAAELFATATVLATVADTLAAAMDAARRSPRLHDPEALTRSVEPLLAYRRELASLVRTFQPKLASLGSGNQAALAQARELRTSGVPRTHALIGDPNQAAAAVRELQRVGAALAPPTAAIRAGFAALENRGELLTYGWAPGPGFHWRTATDVDLRPLLDNLDAAARTAVRLQPAAVQEATGAARGMSAGRQAVPADRGRIVDLSEAIDRRRAALIGNLTPDRAAPRCASTNSLQPSTRSAHPTASPAAP